MEKDRYTKAKYSVYQKSSILAVIFWVCSFYYLDQASKTRIMPPPGRPHMQMRHRASKKIKMHSVWGGGGAKLWCAWMRSEAGSMWTRMVMLLSWNFREQTRPGLKPRWLKISCFSPFRSLTFLSLSLSCFSPFRVSPFAAAIFLKWKTLITSVNLMSESTCESTIIRDTPTICESKFVAIHLRIHRDIGSCEPEIFLRPRISSPLSSCKFHWSSGGWSLLLGSDNYERKD